MSAAIALTANDDDAARDVAASHVIAPPNLTLVEAGWTDLAGNVPSMASRARAEQVRWDAPIHAALAHELGMHCEERAWRIGADGEEYVAHELLELDDDWYVLHAVPVGDRGADIDHVVIGPAGVFTINTKHHPEASVWIGGDAMRVNGSYVQYVRNCRFESGRAATLLASASGREVPVTGIVAVLSGRLTIASQPADRSVLVMPGFGLAGRLARKEQVLSPAAVVAIYDSARRSSTWQPA